MNVVALSGGIGGAKLALGLQRVLPPGHLTVIANTADDFEHLGLYVSPDIDTLVYTLAGLADTQKGWGRADETWTFMSALEALGGPTWFNLGDGDLAMHVLRTSKLAAGETLSEITAEVCRSLALKTRILPMSNEPVRTRLLTDHGWLDFQDYFVARKTEPEVCEIRYHGADQTKPASGVLNAITSPETDAIVICPSNPFISIEPILSVPGVRDALISSTAPIVAVAPIIGGQAVKGPTAKMFHELGFTPSAAAVLDRYSDFLDGYLVDPGDQDALGPASLDKSIVSANIMMHTLDDRERLAQTVLDLSKSIRERR